MRWSVVVLAAGQGTRLRSQLPKVLHELAGRPLIDHVVDLALARVEPDDVIVVVGHGAELVRARVAQRGVTTPLQQPQLGTGDALRVALDALDALGGPGPEAVLVLSGDVPLLRETTLIRLQDAVAAGAEAVLLSAELDEPGCYGRVVRAGDGGVLAVVEAGDARPEVLALREVNAGVYAFRLDALRGALASLLADNVQGEFYLTDVIGVLRSRDRAVEAVVLDDPQEMHGVNTRADLAEVARILNRRLLARLVEAGVTVLDPETTWVEPSCELGRDVILEPGVILRRGCRVGAGARVGAHAVLEGVEVAPGESVPPLTHLRH